MARVRLVPATPKVMFEAGTSAGLEEVAEKTSAASGVSTSPTAREIGPTNVSSSTDWLAIGPMVGGSLIAFTVTLKLRVVMLLLAPPSLTVIVMSAAPLASGNGANVNTPVEVPLV